VTVFAAASLTDAFNKAGDEFARSITRVRLTFNFGSSSTLATQIVNGAPADVFASADEGTMQKVTDAKLNDGVPKIFAGNRLQIAVASGNPKKIGGLADLRWARRTSASSTSRTSSRRPVASRGSRSRNQLRSSRAIRRRW